MQPLVIRVPQFYWTSIYILHGNYFSTGGNTPQFPEFPSLSLGNVVYLLHGEIPTMETGNFHTVLTFSVIMMHDYISI